MRRKPHLKKIPVLSFGIALVLVITAFFVVSPGEKAPSGLLVFTQVPSSLPAAPRYPDQSRIVALDPENPERSLKILTKDFYAARAPEISFDGHKLLFSGKKTGDDPWQIWELEIEGGSPKLLSGVFEDCTDPAYLPADEGIVFTARVPGEQDVYALYTVRLDGCCADRITHHPGSDFSSSILTDGRVLYATGSTSPTGASSAFFATIYDGTKAELYYKNAEGGWFGSRAKETPDRHIVFIELANPDDAGGKLVSIARKRPLNSRIDLAPDLPGRFHSVFPAPSGGLYVSYRETDDVPYNLHYFDPATGLHGPPLTGEDYHDIEPVLALSRPRIPAFPSVNDRMNPTGQLFCLNVDVSTIPPATGSEISNTGRTLRVVGSDGLLGEAPIEVDGSFSITVPADTPIRLLTVDKNGQVVRGPSEWIWVRPNEQRGCIGCHENRELAPPNVLPLAITQPSVSIGSPIAEGHTRPGDVHGM